MRWTKTQKIVNGTMINNMIRLFNSWTKIEMIAAVILTAIILGYAVCPNRSQKDNSSLEVTSSTTQP